MHVRRGIPSDEIFDFLFRGTLLNKKYLRHLCHKMHSPTFATEYLLGPHLASGRPRLLSRQENVIVGMLARKLKVFRTIRFRETYLTNYYGRVRGANVGPSESTMLRVLHRHGFTRKVKETRHILCNPQEGVHFLQRISHLNPVHCIDIDETACSRDSFLEKYGWAPEGERCVASLAHQGASDIFLPPKAKKIYGWMQLVIKKGLPLTMVSDPFYDCRHCC